MANKIDLLKSIELIAAYRMSFELFFMIFSQTFVISDLHSLDNVLAETYSKYEQLLEGIFSKQLISAYSIK